MLTQNKKRPAVSAGLSLPVLSSSKQLAGYCSLLTVHGLIGSRDVWVTEVELLLELCAVGTGIAGTAIYPH